jgi:hypothetical protein
MKEQQQLVASGSVGPQVEQLAAALVTAQAETEQHRKQQHQPHKQKPCTGASSTGSCSKSASTVGSSSSRASRAAAGSRPASTLAAASACGATQRHGSSASQCGSAMTSTTTVSPFMVAIYSIQRVQHDAIRPAALYATAVRAYERWFSLHDLCMWHPQCCITHERIPCKQHSVQDANSL